MRISDRIADLVDEAIAARALGESIDFEVGVAPAQTAAGVVIVANVLVFGSNPILGAGQLAIGEMLPVDLAVQPEAISHLVDRLLAALRQAQTDALLAPRR